MSTGWLYVTRDPMGRVVGIEDAPAPRPKAFRRRMRQILNRRRRLARISGAGLPSWAVKAGKIMHAIQTPALRDAGWRCFGMVEIAAKQGNRCACQIREGLRRIARALQRQRGIGDDDPLAEIDNLPDTIPYNPPEAGGSIRA